MPVKHTKTCLTCAVCGDNCTVNRIADYTPKKDMAGNVVECIYWTRKKGVDPCVQ